MTKLEILVKNGILVKNVFLGKNRNFSQKRIQSQKNHIKKSKIEKLPKKSNFFPRKDFYKKFPKTDHPTELTNWLTHVCTIVTIL